MRPSGLPIDDVLPALARALDAPGLAVLTAPPGAGKTTIVPLALLESAWLGERIVLLLEPRRLAARAAARRMAQLLGESPGGRVGYRIRRESAVGPATRVEVVTEGILTRMIQRDPDLARVGCVIFDEFHERNLHSDLGLALALESRAVLRPDLRLLVMSATLDGERVARLMGEAPVVRSEGRLFPVETRYLTPAAGQRLESSVAAAVRRTLAEEEGDLLVFLPGQAEIRRSAEQLTGPGAPPLPAGTRVLPLYGLLSNRDQDAAIRPAPPGTRKVVLATSIAETSLTIEGVRVVIDAGLARVAKYSPGSGMTRLATVRVTKDSADQRRGRAGRTAPGVCCRLWPAAEDSHLLPRATPEILEADLTALALELAVAGVSDPSRLAWLDPPPAAALAEARALLGQLGAMRGDGTITAHGRKMAEVGVHPRLAHLLIRGTELGAGAAAARLAALLEQRDILRPGGVPLDADIELRLELIPGREVPAVHHGHDVDRNTLQLVRQESRGWSDLLRWMAVANSPGAAPGAAELLALAYPDRVGQRREGQVGRFLLRNGAGVITDSPTLARAEYIVAADLDGDRRESRVWLGAALDRADLDRLFREDMREDDIVEWDDRSDAVIAVRRTTLGAIIVEQRPLREPSGDLVRGALLGWIRREGVGILPWDEDAARLRQRLAFLHAQLGPPWPDVSDDALLLALEEWLVPSLAGVRRRDDLGRIDLTTALLTRLGWEERRSLDALAPTHVEVPSGSRIRLDYGDPAAPILPVRLQEVFGLQETPRIAGGRVPVTMQLLSPARRPVQVTRDLGGFWRTSYFDVKKEMKGRYPRHDWPDDPLRAAPSRGTSRTRKRPT
ncbi:MAG: ATP-dependent helicase HrpB [Gemmatimonadota bacterium]|nr:ATP-dependent helicase HrpB [Gemmatimonadota bacterium]